MGEYKDAPMGWGARIATAIGLGILMAIIAMRIPRDRKSTRLHSSH